MFIGLDLIPHVEFWTSLPGLVKVMILKIVQDIQVIVEGWSEVHSFLW